MTNPEEMAILASEPFYFHVTCKERFLLIDKFGLNPATAQRDDSALYDLIPEYCDNPPLFYCTEAFLPSIINMKIGYWGDEKEPVVLRLPNHCLTSRESELDRSHGDVIRTLRTHGETTEGYRLALAIAGCVACIGSIPRKEFDVVPKSDWQAKLQNWMTGK